MDSFTSSDWNATGLKGSGSQKYLGLIDPSTRSTALKCQSCGRACRHFSEDWHDFLFKQPWTIAEAIAAAAHPQRYTLVGMRCASCCVAEWEQSRGSGSISFVIEDSTHE
jgi:hypothetical protein